MWTDFVEGVRAGMFRHFKNHFNSPHRPVAYLPINILSKHIDDVGNSMLEACLRKDEVRNAIWSCNANKNPRLDDFIFGFIKENWGLPKTETMGMMTEFQS